MTDLTAERLRQLLDYDPKTGIFTRRVDRGRSWKAGSVCGSHSRAGRMQINIDARNYQFSRAVWLYMAGTWPIGDVDHINGDPSDNTWRNLRDVSHRTNQENRRTAAKGNKSGYLGVTAHQGRFQASITISGKRKHLGMYGTALEAHAAYIEVKRKRHKGCTI